MGNIILKLFVNFAQEKKLVLFQKKLICYKNKKKKKKKN